MRRKQDQSKKLFVDQIHLDPDYETLTETDEVVQSLANSYKEIIAKSDDPNVEVIIEPIIVQLLNDTTKKDNYIIAGRKRIKALYVAGMQGRSIPVIVKDVSDYVRNLFISLENLCRKQYSPWELAKELSDYKAKIKQDNPTHPMFRPGRKSKADLEILEQEPNIIQLAAKESGKEIGTIRNRLSVYENLKDDRLKNYVIENDVAIATAQGIAQWDEKDQKAYADILDSDKNPFEFRDAINKNAVVAWQALQKSRGNNPNIKPKKKDAEPIEYINDPRDYPIARSDIHWLKQFSADLMKYTGDLSIDKCIRITNKKTKQIFEITYIPDYSETEQYNEGRREHILTTKELLENGVIPKLFVLHPRHNDFKHDVLLNETKISSRELISLLTATSKREGI